jgi:hypothetical protein
MSGHTYYSRGYESREQHQEFTSVGVDEEKQAYEENLSKFKGWSWDLWTYFINVVDGMATLRSLRRDLFRFKECCELKLIWLFFT